MVVVFNIRHVKPRNTSIDIENYVLVESRRVVPQDWMVFYSQNLQAWIAGGDFKKKSCPNVKEKIAV